MKIRLTRAIAAIGMAAMALLAPHTASAADIVVKHKQGEARLAKMPSNILVFDLAALDILQALGVEVAGVPTGNKPDYLKSFDGDRYLKIGSFFEPDYEAVISAAPDLIIIAGRSAPRYADLSKIAPTIDLTADAANFLNDARGNVETLGRIFGKETAATELLAKLDVSVAALRSTAAQKGSGLFVLTSGGKLNAYGPGSRFGVLYDDFGIKPAAATNHAGNHGQAISFEYLLQTDPDWLFVLDRDVAIGQGGEAAQKLLDNSIMADTKAWKTGHIVYLDGISWYLVSGGITALQNAVEQIRTELEKA